LFLNPQAALIAASRKNEDPMIKSLLFPLLSLCASLGLAQPARASDDNVLSDTERSTGWRLLFDGHSLAGWRSLSSAQPGAGWAVVDGAIVRTARSGDLLSSDEFGDFELSIDWKVEDATNSGILYRVALGEKQTYYTGPEYQLLDNIKGGDRFDPKHLAGALYDLVAPPKDFTKPVGSWNHTRIVVRGWHIEHWLNGEKIVDVDLSGPEGQALKMHSKFNAMPHFAAYSRGHIALQDHDNMVSFRNIKIRDLPVAP
jgi:3-keto-disaccharide hydrolase